MTDPELPEHDPQGLDLAKRIARAARGAAPKPGPKKRRPAKRTDEPTPLGELLKLGIVKELAAVRMLAIAFPELPGDRALMPLHRAPQGGGPCCLRCGQAQRRGRAGSVRPSRLDAGARSRPSDRYLQRHGAAA